MSQSSFNDGGGVHAHSPTLKSLNVMGDRTLILL